MIAARKYLALILLLLPICGWGENVSTQGKDFWLTFLPNPWTKDIKLEILVASRESCRGAVVNPLTGWSTSFSVTPGIVTRVQIPTDEGLMEKENEVESKALHVTTTAEVSLYMSNFMDASYDASNVLPTDILMGNYIAQSYPVYSPIGYPGIDLHSRMVIVATENDTEVEIDPKGGLYKKIPAGKKRTITLDAGQCYMVFSNTGDISGTRVKSINGKKIAVFSGGDTQIPLSGCCFDAVFEQCMPIEYWGRQFVVTSTMLRDNDKVRITSIAPKCVISINGKKKKVLGARQTYEFELDSKTEAAYIETSSPVMTCIYFTSASHGGIMGDPSMVYINPVEQKMDEVTFATYNTNISQTHYVNAVTLSSTVSGMKLDGVSIASDFKQVPFKKEFSFARIKVKDGSHTMSSDGSGFVAHVYGLGHYESYAYSVGSNSRVLNQINESGDLEIDVLPPIVEPESVPEQETETEMEYESESVVPNEIPEKTLSEIHFDPITLEDLKNGSPIRGAIKDELGEILSPEDFDITVEMKDSYLYKSIGVENDGDELKILLTPRDGWCDCFIPDEIHANVIMTPKRGQMDKENRVYQKTITPIVVPIIKKSPWLYRCYRVIASLILLVLSMIYLRALIHKRRFGKDAKIEEYYTESYEETFHVSKKLRNKGLFAWLNRWFNPFVPERRSLRFTASVDTILHFEAGDTKGSVYISSSDYDDVKMNLEGYYPASSISGKKPPIKWMRGRNMILGKDQGRLYYNEGRGDDISSYKVFLGLLQIAVIVTIIILVILLIRSFY